MRAGVLLMGTLMVIITSAVVAAEFAHQPWALTLPGVVAVATLIVTGFGRD